MTDRYTHLVGVGGIGSGIFFHLRGNHTLGRNESRAGTILRRRDFCKLHIIAHYVAVLMGAGRGRLDVLPIGKVGDDAAGREMVELMRQAGMDTRFVAVEPDRATLSSVCFTYDDGDGGNITNDDSASSLVTPADVEQALAALGPVERGIALAAPEVPLVTRLRLLELAGPGWFKAVAVTTAEVQQALDMGLFAHSDLVSLNKEEAAALVAGCRGRGVRGQALPAAAPDGIAGRPLTESVKGRPPGVPTSDIETVVQAGGERLAAAKPGIGVCVTAGAAGMYGWENGRIEHTPACPTTVVCTAGAGDATLSALIVAEAAGLPFVLPDRPRRKALTDAPLATALDLAALLAALAVACEDTINFSADAPAILNTARAIGADASALAGALQSFSG